jgi:hypothetical protein
MTTIVTRQGKGSPLTNAEVDQNVINLNNDKVDVAGSYANPAWLTSLAEAKVLPSQTGQSGKYLQTNGTGTSWVTLDLSAKADVGGGNATGTWPISVTGNAATVTNGVYTSGSYANPAWITSLAEAKVLPAQTGKAGKYLQTNGTSTSWATLTNPNNGTLTMAVSGTGLSGSATFTADQSGNSTFTVTSNATSANTASTIVARDASGNFSAGTITATLSGNASTATNADQLDGQHGSYYQPASTAITTSNIGSQSVSYATTAGNGGVTSVNGQTGAVTVSGFPTGTVMLFRQTSAPTGWTKDTTNYNDSAIRVVTGSVSSGGSAGFTTAFASQTPSGSVSVNVSGLSAGATTLSTAQMPSHSHQMWYVAGGGGQSFDAPTRGDFRTDYQIWTGAQGGSSSHSHSMSGSATGSFSGNAINLAVKYCDVIFATKD